ncbi:hypothetical protein RND71_026434 [Anisodus tanguticus]|uniref:Uncharacterized protein n=1 Tax=Anisodus tanguticus TaxID=243964 RepID=A0AAE1RMD3_9SOLA|nr:hypothetical protein RND71_026434 [Anisodus tanguticus]
MTTGSLDLRSSGSYGSLQFATTTISKHSGSPFSPPPPPPRSTTEAPKMFNKDKEGLFLWICKLAPRKKVGMLQLFHNMMGNIIHCQDIHHNARRFITWRATSSTRHPSQRSTFHHCDGHDCLRDFHTIIAIFQSTYRIDEMQQE